MSLIKDSNAKTFDISSIKKNDFISVKKDTWDKPVLGIALIVKEDRILIEHHPGTANVSSHMFITPDEISSGAYSIKWSSDLETINSYPENEVENYEQ